MIPVVFAGKREQQAANKGITGSGGIDDLHARGRKKELSLGGDKQRSFGPQRNDGGLAAQIAHVIPRILPVAGAAQLTQLICRDFADRRQRSGAGDQVRDLSGIAPHLAAQVDIKQNVAAGLPHSSRALKACLASGAVGETNGAKVKPFVFSERRQILR